MAPESEATPGCARSTTSDRWGKDTHCLSEWSVDNELPYRLYGPSRHAYGQGRAVAGGGNHERRRSGGRTNCVQTESNGRDRTHTDGHSAATRASQSLARQAAVACERGREGSTCATQHRGRCQCARTHATHRPRCDRAARALPKRRQKRRGSAAGTRYRREQGQGARVSCAARGRRRSRDRPNGDYHRDER